MTSLSAIRAPFPTYFKLLGKIKSNVKVQANKIYITLFAKKLLNTLDVLFQK